MPTQLSPGRYRGLKSTSLAERDVFGIVAFDQRGSYRKMMPEGASYEMLAQVKGEIIGALSKEASAILTDPAYGLNAAMEMSPRAGLLLALEKSGYSGDSSYRKTELIPSWTPEKIRKAGASAVKFMVYYHPESGALAEELEGLIGRVVADCHQWDLPVFLEPMSYSLDPAVSKDSADFAAERPAVVIETARRLSRSGADVLKLEFPLDIKFNPERAEWHRACAALSEASAVPWVLLSAGVDFDQFKPQAQVACERGASGFLAGRAIWKEAAAMSQAARADFLENTARDRLRKLLDIAAASARPWTDFYRAPQSSETWYESYS
ncbi:MAG: tagatose 1,6-diphosphate aldolase [Chloroflexi bacterium]|nr:tagatose 1,6-diphosphate aldolase [Chloroflexota bacterium]